MKAIQYTNWVVAGMGAWFTVFWFGSLAWEALGFREGDWAAGASCLLGVGGTAIVARRRPGLFNVVHLGTFEYFITLFVATLVSYVLGVVVVASVFSLLTWTLPWRSIDVSMLAVYLPIALCPLGAALLAAQRNRRKKGKADFDRLGRRGESESVK